LEDIIINLS